MRTSCRICLILILACMGVAGAAPLRARDTDRLRLLELRAHQRAASRQDLAEKSTPGEFGLLVIPVDFADARLSGNWNPGTDLMPQLYSPSGPSLEHYFAIASRGRLDMRVTLTPLVHLPDERRLYSDIGQGGNFLRTRKLARESIQGALAAGVEFRRLDLQGDDGQVDGVLILHAGIGQENDTLDGLIQPLQFYLEEPVEDDGIQATTYAVASLQSGLGIWAHETGHLLGMEDRYDPLLHPVAGAVDVRSLGGLGRFSLMSSGAWGTGGGENPALPDAYNCLQLGWIGALPYPSSGTQDLSIAPWLESGFVHQVWTHGTPAEEFFLLETRDPAASAPYDAGLAGNQLLITHVDESVPEGYIVEDSQAGYHLRVRLVEADGEEGLRLGEDDGSAADLFPGSLNVTAFTPTTIPSSQGYTEPSLVRLENIRQEGGRILLTASASTGPAVLLHGEVQFPGDGTATLALEAESTGMPFTILDAVITIFGDGGGVFPSGGTLENVPFTEQETSPLLEAEITLTPPAIVQPGAETMLQVVPRADGQDLPATVFRFVWETAGGALAIEQVDWQLWEEEFPAGNTATRWRHWNGAPYLTVSGTPVLACVGEDFVTSADWPRVRYANGSRAVLISPPLDPAVRAVRMTHAIEVEFLHPGTLMDGAFVWWQDPSGRRIPAHPMEGYDGTIDPGSSNPLRGSGALGDSLLVLDAQDRPQWRVDTFPTPLFDAGPWRLVLDFASNGLWAGRGWFIARLEGLVSSDQGAFDLTWEPEDDDCPGLGWDWPVAQSPLSSFQLETFDSASRRFEVLAGPTVWETSCRLRYLVETRGVQNTLFRDGNRRHLLRVRADSDLGPVVSRPVFIYPDGGPDIILYLEKPYPNPSRDAVRFRVEWPGPGLASVGVYDLRGRRLHQQELYPGRQQLVWDGSGPDGRRAAAGTYFLRLEGSGRQVTRKVVLLH